MGAFDNIGRRTKAQIPSFDFGSSGGGGGSGIDPITLFMFKQIMDKQSGAQEAQEQVQQQEQALGQSVSTKAKTPAGVEQVSNLGIQQAGAGNTLKKAIQQRETFRTNFGEVKGLFGNMMSQIQGRKAEQGGRLGLIPGLKGNIRGALGRENTGRIEASGGQAIETAVRQSKFLTGQNRVIKSLLAAILTSIPDSTDTSEAVSQKIRQSMFNAFTSMKIINKAGFSLEELNRMTDADLDNDPRAEVFDAGQLNLTEEDLAEFEQHFAEVQRAPVAPRVETLPIDIDAANVLTRPGEETQEDDTEDIIAAALAAMGGK